MSFNSVKLRVPAVIQSLFGFGFIVLLCMLTYRIHPDKSEARDTYTASIFGAGFAADWIIKPDGAMHALGRRDTGAFSDLNCNLATRYHEAEATKSTTKSQVRFEKIMLDDAYQTGTQFFAISKRVVPRQAANNTFEKAARIQANRIELKDSPCKFELHGQGCENRKSNSIIREGK